MDWKRILNKKEESGRKQTVGKPPEDRKPTEGKKPTDRKKLTGGEKVAENEMEEYLQALVTELNFRLLMEGKEKDPPTDRWEILMAMQPEHMLWVESITLTSYEKGVKKPARSWKPEGQYFKKTGNRTVNFFRRLFTRRRDK